MTQTSSSSRGAGRVNIAFTAKAEEAGRRLVDRFPFGGLVDVARVGVALALREKLPLERDHDFGSANGSNYNVGSIDPQGELRELLLALHPEITEDPYRVIETLMSAGTLELDRRVAAGKILSLRDLIAPEPS